MKIFRILRSIRNKTSFKKYYSTFTYAAPIRLTNINNHIKRTPLKDHNIGRFSTENEDETEDSPILEIENLDHIEQTKYFLFNNPNDSVIIDLSNCSTLNEVWNILNKHRGSLTEEQITQTFLSLKDIQTVFCNTNCLGSNPAKEYSRILKESTKFNELLHVITIRLNEFDPNLLSYVFVYLRKLGANIDDPLMLQIAEKLQKRLEQEFNLGVCSRWMKVIFMEKSLKPYYMCLNLIPKVINAIDKCDSYEELSNISVCLNKIHNLITSPVLKRYTDKVNWMLNKKILKSSDHSTILKVISFLSLPYWRDENTELISKCILMLKNEVNRLDIPYLLLLYEVFFKIQEPGDILNEIQRNTAKYWQQFEETGTLDTNTALKIFSSLIFFSSPLHRIQLRQNVEKLLKPNMDLRNLILMRKIFSYVKISDKDLCHKYWDIWSGLLKEESDLYIIVRSCLNYIQFNIDIDNYRNLSFEKQVLELITRFVSQGDVIFPADLPFLLTFTILYSDDKFLLNDLLKRLKRNEAQIKSKEILLLSQTFGTRSKCCNEENFTELKNALNKSTEHLLSFDDKHFETNSTLIKAAIMRNDYEEYLMENLILKFKDVEYMSSKLMDTISFIFMSTSTLVPEVINKITEYIVNNRNNVIGFNAEKILYMSFHLAYYPINANKFFQTVTDIIIRDQERLSGLAFLQSALALSFFNKLPSFLVKQIFNVEFLDRLDNELANCYSKDKYPQRVRQTLMYLNRTVCLEYPEFNVPWFHEKYIKDVEKQNALETNIPLSLREYLVDIAGQNAMEYIVTPYGYHIDFVINLDKEHKVVSQSSESITKRVALLLVKQQAFTRFYTHLRGTYQMKIKHLEIMGYSVSILKLDDWLNLLYTTERLDYLRKLIWPETYESRICDKKAIYEK